MENLTGDCLKSLGRGKELELLNGNLPQAGLNDLMLLMEPT